MGNAPDPLAQGPAFFATRSRHSSNMWPEQQRLTHMRGFAPTVTLVGGGIGTLAAMVMVYLAQVSHHQARALDLTQQRLQSILDSLLEGIYMLDTEGRVTFANPAACQSIGYTMDELKGQPLHDLVHHSHRDRTPYRHDECPVNRVLLNGGSIHVESEVFWHKDGWAFPVEYVAQVAQDKDSNRFGCVLSARDIGTREDQLARYARALEQSNRELDDFAYAASHDLRSPLRGIEQLASWIEEDLGENVDEETSRNLKLMRSRIKRLERLLNDLLAYSRIGRTDNKLSEVDTATLVRETFELLAPPKGFRLEVDSNMPTFITVRAPFEQLFRNLFSNALKHHDRQEGTIQVTCAESENGYEFAVKDDGPGIPQEHHDRIFALFKSLKPRDQVEGSGMGLALVKKTVATYGGWVTVESTAEQRGTTFRVYWPTGSSQADNSGGRDNGND